MERQKNFDKDREPREKEFVEKLVTLNRTSKTVKGGRRMSFAALSGLLKTSRPMMVRMQTTSMAVKNVIIVPLDLGVPNPEMKSGDLLTGHSCRGLSGLCIYNHNREELV